MRRPSVSVAIPVFNGAVYLESAIKSVLAQRQLPDEIRVLDNGSTDGSREIAIGLLGADAVLARHENVGAVTNFNEGATGSAADADYFLWLAADDRLHPDFVTRTVAVLEAQPEKPACLTAINFIDPAGQSVETVVNLPLASADPSLRFRAFLCQPRWTEFYCLYRRSSLLDSPLMAPEYGADVMLTWWFLLRSPFAVTSDVLVDYRIYPAKTVSETAATLDPSAPKGEWHMWRLWTRLWSMTADADLSPDVQSVARRQLLRAAVHRTWLKHFASDVVERWPRLRPLATRVRDHLK